MLDNSAFDQSLSFHTRPTGSEQLGELVARQCYRNDLIATGELSNHGLSTNKHAINYTSIMQRNV